jgi:N-acetylglutamate synthase-like GNAT family acetyltransferase
MSLGNLQVRRATIDDLSVLRGLWRQAQLPVDLLEKRLGDFQIVETATGEVLGTIALQIAGAQGRLHSEAYAAPELADDLRARLWNRVLSLARHKGLARLWMEAGGAVFWIEQELEPASQELIDQLPAAFPPSGKTWLTLKLREESDRLVSVERELALFREAEKAQTQRVLDQARILKLLAAVIVLTLMGIVAFGLWLLFWGAKKPRTPFRMR